MARLKADVIKEYRRLAKRADDRLRALEKLAGQEYFHGVKDYAYKRALRDIRAWGGDQRFLTKPPRTVKQIQAKIADINTFLDSITSTKTGIKSVYQQRGNTLSDQLGLTGKERPTWQQWADFWESDLAKDMKQIYGSKMMVSVIAQFQSNRKEMIEAIRSGDYSNVHVEPAMIQSATESFLREHGTEYGELFFNMQPGD